MADRPAGSVAVAVLLAELRADREALVAHMERVRDAIATGVWQDDSPTLAVVAVAAHHFYGACESMFERIARLFEGLPERSDRWHQELLERMAVPIDGVRPAVVRGETARALAPVLGFRHFFRHAYAVRLDPRRLRLAADDVVRAGELLERDLDAFEAVLSAATRA